MRENAAFRPVRAAGPPPSANGASSLHLLWVPAPTDALVEVAAVLEVLTLPQVDALYFWALQVAFGSPAGPTAGAAHLGLQWGAGRRPNRHVNFGGYGPGGGELDGSASPLPSSLRNPNTRDFSWEHRRPYELRVRAAGGGRWRGEVVDPGSGTVAHVRDLFAPGDRLVQPMVWSEVFADCDAPSVSVRWSGLRAVTAHGEQRRCSRVRVHYQRYEDGGCTNTTAAAHPLGVLQSTGTPRSVQPGDVLPLPGGGQAGKS